MTLLDVQLESTTCLCGSTKPPVRSVSCCDEVSGLLFYYHRCRDCGLDVLNPRPTAAAIGPFYPTTYYAYQTDKGANERFRHWVERIIVQVYFAPFSEMSLGLKVLWPFLVVLLFPLRRWPVLAFTQPKIKRVFEFGAATGCDLLTFRAAGWTATGCEPSKQACDVAATRGLSLQCCAAEDAILDHDAYTCVFMNNVFEHLHDPLAVLQKAHDGLMEGGFLILIVPNHDSWSARVLRGNWAGYDGPRHIYGYSPRTLRQLLTKHGFCIEYIAHRPAFRWLWYQAATTWLRNRGLNGRIGLKFASFFSVIALPFAALSALFYRGDFIKVVARKALKFPSEPQ